MASSAVTAPAAGARRLARISTWGIVVWAAAGAYAVVLTAESIHRQERFMTGFDTAVEDQLLWLAAHDHHLFSTILDRSFFANHIQPGLLLLTPFYWFGLGVPMLLTAQSLALALVAPGLFALARDRGASPKLAAVPALLWLVSPWTAHVNLYEFHPEVFVPVLLIVGVLASLHERWIILGTTATVAMSFKEDVPLVYVMLGVVLILSGKRRPGAILAVASGAIFVVLNALAAHQGNAYAYFEHRFAGSRGDTVGQAFVWMLEHPARTLLDVIGQSGAADTALLMATAGLALLAPRWLLLAVPTLAHNALSAYPLQHTLDYQYHLLASVGLFIAAAVGAHRLPTLTRPTRMIFLVIGGVAALFAVLGLLQLHTSQTPRQEANAARIRRALALVPPDASVAASIVFQPHLSHRANLYTLPEPFIAVDWNGSSTPAEMARRARGVQFVAFFAGSSPIDYRHRLGGSFVLRLKRQGFVQIYRSGPVAVLERKNK